MTREPAHRPDPTEPLDTTTLAEIDAGLPDDVEAARRRAAVAGDPRAEAVLDALAATRADLAALPAPQVPANVGARWAAALATEGATVPSLDRDTTARGGAEASPGRHVSPLSGARRTRRPFLVAAVLAAVVAAGVGALLSGTREPPALTVARVDLVAVATDAVGTTDVGALSDPDRRVGCLRTVAPAAVDEALLGGRRVVLDGRPGVLLVLATGTRGGLRIVTVDPACGPDGGTLLTQVLVV